MSLKQKILSFFLLALFIFSIGCGKIPKFKKTDARSTPTNALERARKNIDEGRGASLGGLLKKGRGTNYEFSTSNPMWRASLEILDFLPLSVVDYSGGMIFGYRLNKHLGLFLEGKYNKYWNREWYNFKCGVNYVIF